MEAEKLIGAERPVAYRGFGITVCQGLSATLHHYFKN